MTAGDWRPTSRKVLCPNCGTEAWFKNSERDRARFSCESGCGASFTQPGGPGGELLWEGAEEPDWEGGLDLDLVVAEPSQVAPIDLAPVLDLSLPIGERAKSLMGLLRYAAAELVKRDAEDDPEAYEDEDFCRQEVARRTLKEITDLRTIAATLELQWAMDHADEQWVDADGEAVTLEEVLETQMPDEEQRKSSGRARQVAAFQSSAVPAFKAAGFSEGHIAQCGRSGMSSVLGIVSSTQHKLAEAGLEPEDLQARYGRLIEAAAGTTTLQGLREEIKGILDPGYAPAPSIPYSVENDGDEHWWFIARPTHDQFTEVVLGKLGGVLELDRQLPEYFYRYWGEWITVPPGQ